MATTFGQQPGDWVGYLINSLAPGQAHGAGLAMLMAALGTPTGKRQLLRSARGRKRRQLKLALQHLNRRTLRQLMRRMA
jgi:hypothetical protein